MKKVYKYRANTIDDTRDKDAILLSKGYFFASSLMNLNDPFEGSVEWPTANQNNQWIKYLMQDLMDVGIYSLSAAKESENFPSNELLWAHYANSHKGFCIEYDLDILKNNLSPTFDIRNVMKVVYHEDRPIVSSSDNLFELQQKVFGTKSMAWEYENELRVIFCSQGLKQIVPYAITAIYFGLNISQEDRNEIICLMKDKCDNFFQMKRLENSYRLGIECYKPLVNE